MFAFRKVCRSQHLPLTCSAERASTVCRSTMFAPIPLYFLTICWHLDAIWTLRPSSLTVQVMYDASGVRLHAGRQASVLNMIITELPPDHPVSDTRPLRDTLGHTPLQVAVGAMLGMVIGYIVGVSWHTS